MEYCYYSKLSCTVSLRPYPVEMPAYWHMDGTHTVSEMGGYLWTEVASRSRTTIAEDRNRFHIRPDGDLIQPESRPVCP